MQFFDQVLLEKVPKSKHRTEVVRTASALDSDGFVLEKMRKVWMTSDRRQSVWKDAKLIPYLKHGNCWRAVDGPTPNGWILLKDGPQGLILCRGERLVEVPDLCPPADSINFALYFSMRDLPGEEDEVLVVAFLLDVGPKSQDQLKILTSRDPTWELLPRNSNRSNVPLLLRENIHIVPLKEIGFCLAFPSGARERILFDPTTKRASLETDLPETPTLEGSEKLRGCLWHWSPREELVGGLLLFGASKGVFKLWRQVKDGSRSIFEPKDKEVVIDRLPPGNPSEFQLIGNDLALVRFDRLRLLFVDFRLGQSKTFKSLDKETWIGRWSEGTCLRLKRNRRGKLQLVKTQVLRQSDFAFVVAWAEGCRNLLNTFSDQQRVVALEVMKQTQSGVMPEVSS